FNNPYEFVGEQRVNFGGDLGLVGLPLSGKMPCRPTFKRLVNQRPNFGLVCAVFFPLGTNFVRGLHLDRPPFPLSRIAKNSEYLCHDLHPWGSVATTTTALCGEKLRSNSQLISCTCVRVI